MPILIDPEVEGRVLALHSENYSKSAIVSRLSRLGIAISTYGVHNIIHGKGKRRVAKANGEVYKQTRRRMVRTRRTINKVQEECKKENPVSQRQLANRFGCALSTMNRMIHEDLGLQSRKKPRVHALTKDQMKRRALRFKRLLDSNLAESNLPYCCTIDESWLYLQDCNRTSDICYRVFGIMDTDFRCLL